MANYAQSVKFYCQVVRNAAQ